MTHLYQAQRASLVQAAQARSETVAEAVFVNGVLVCRDRSSMGEAAMRSWDEFLSEA
jgi:hypothetical protein